MQKTGCANLPLHPGKCPPWLFGRMKILGAVVSEIIVDEYGQEEYLKRLSDPFFFQAFGCILGFDHHSSGVTTTVCGALKEANLENLGIKFCGGKGAVSRKTPQEIENNEFNLTTQKIDRLKYSSRMAAKVDNSLVQDNYRLYHHCFIFTEKGKWAVVQQGLNPSNKYARRYHWLSENIVEFVNEPHNAICCDEKEENTLNMASKKSEESRKASVDLVNDNPAHLTKYIKQKPIKQKLLCDFDVLDMKPEHPIYIEDLTEKTLKSLQKAYEINPENYEELVALRGIGPKSVRALALISELIYGAKPSWKDPAKYSFAHGGKDGYPYPVERSNYDMSIEILKEAVNNARIGEKEKMNAVRRLSSFI